MKKIDDEVELVDPDHPRPSVKTGKIRCGFCVTGHHDKCCIAIPLGKDSTRHTWRCACNCNIGRTKCVNCNRRDVEVTSQSTCLDAEDCKVYRDTKRRQYMAELTGTVPPEIPGDGQTPKPKPRASVAKVCLCCGEPTRGGKFLPGHDARYLSLQLKRYLEEDDKGAVLEEVRQISESLLGKLQIRVKKVTQESEAQQ